MKINTVSVTAILPAHKRVTEVLKTVRNIQNCDPGPSEILVHVAESELKTRNALQSLIPGIRLILSNENLGPGGARNKLIRAASNELIVSFDDDSYPVDTDFFSNLLSWFEKLPEASIFALNIFEGTDSPPRSSGDSSKVRDFVGCGCAYRRSHFLEVPGYVPIPIAYGMEEADLSLQYTANGREIHFVPALRVYHDTVLVHHASAKVAGMQVANTALLVFLRYPWQRWPLGIGQIINKWLDTVRRRRWKGALLAGPLIAAQIWNYRSFRKVVSKEILNTYRSLRGRRSYAD